MLLVPMDDHRELSLQRAQYTIDVQSDEPVWTPARRELWQRIETHDFEPDTALNLTTDGVLRKRAQPSTAIAASAFLRWFRQRR
jgi:hypothetical protein